MAKYTKSEVVEKAAELAKLIAETEEVEFFKRAEEAINKNDKVYRLMEDIKHYQKQAVNFKHYNKPEALKKVEDKIDALMAELDEIPVVEEFKRSQVVVNDLLQLVSSTISQTVTNEIIVSTGGDLLQGKTGSKPGCHQEGGCEHEHQH
ncbi:RicAFT regulatory complex protein RicA family protein [Calidifontibacillus oryziterrae]|uniref:RicAFT regulatory complex protein RicA family protein n=1 Tax=Calidifontibacillus oryziterrae TaxID=1191699 RepID=UPI0002EEFCF4|nr:RicAFT regulatory complex protein RicA family protein [Calidifontibacillus oryziterrae]